MGCHLKFVSDILTQSVQVNLKIIFLIGTEDIFLSVIEVIFVGNKLSVLIIIQNNNEAKLKLLLYIVWLFKFFKVDLIAKLIIMKDRLKAITDRNIKIINECSHNTHILAK